MTDQLQPTSLPAIATSAMLIHLTIRDRKKVLFDNDVKSMTSLNDKGVFDILPQHENFIAIIRDYITIRKKDGREEKMKIQSGILKVKKNQINCYINLLAALPIVNPGTATP